MLKTEVLISCFLDLLYPRTCYGCGCPLQKEHTALCGKCAATILFITTPFCRVCGAPLAYGGEFCFGCETRRWSFGYSRGIVVYKGIVRRMLLDFKYRRKEYLAAFFKLMIRDYFAHGKVFPQVDAVVPVPLHPTALRERGFNQAQVFAEYAAASLSAPCLSGALERTRKTRPQYDLDKKLRQKNMQGAFDVPVPEIVEGKSILVVDDIGTTLSTLDEASLILRKHGAEKAYGFVVARD